MLQVPLFKPKSDWKPPHLPDLPSWKGAKRVGLDLETCDPQLKKLGPGPRRDGRIVGVSFCIEDHKPYYLPFGHMGGGNLDGDMVRRYLSQQAKDFKGEIVGANLQYEMDYLLEWGVYFTPKFWRDVLIAEPLLDENQFRYSLNEVAKRRGYPGKKEEHLRHAAEAYGVDPKAEMYKLPSEHVGPYAEEDARLPLALLRTQEEALKQEQLESVFDLESRVLPVCLSMRRVGVAIDFDRLDEIENWTLAEELAALKRTSELSGVRLGMGASTKPAVLAPVFEAIGVKVPKTEKTGQPSIKDDWLKTIDHPVAEAVRRARKMNKVRCTFVKSIRTHETNGRVHCSFNQLKGESGKQKQDETSGTVARLSSSNPNLQQQPARDPEIGPMWRSIFLPDDDGEWACLDFSQQEPRMLIHYAYRTGCIGADKARTRYRENPRTDVHSMMASVVFPEFRESDYLDPEHKNHKNCKKVRTDSKTIFLAMCYGMGGAKLCKKLGLPTGWWEDDKGRQHEGPGEEGKKLIYQFNAAVPYIKQLARKCEAIALKRGYVRTLLGRRQHFPYDHTGKNFDWTFKAMNRLIQGSAADQMKLAMAQAHEAGIRLQLQVHDELDLTIWNRQEAEELAEIMRTAVTCEVPHLVDIETGPNWGEIK